MKKLLLGMLSFMILLVLFNVVVKFNDNIDDDINLSESTNMPNNSIPSYDTTVVEEDKPFAPIDVDNQTDLANSWKVESNGGSCGANEYEYNYIFIENAKVGSYPKANQMFKDLVPLVYNNEYLLKFTISCTVNRSIIVSIINGDNMEIIKEDTFNIGSEEQTIEYKFTMPKESIINGRINFYFGNDGVSDYHTITFKDISFENLSVQDDSIKINHLGYAPNNQKRCVFPYNQGDYFKVINVETNDVVYMGAIKKEVHNELTGEINYYGDFTNVMEPGIYRIESQVVGKSSNFVISNGLYKSVFLDAFKFFSIQRCGYELDYNIFNDYSHKQCHTSEAYVYDLNGEKVNVSGGWHDAGDFGRYVQTGVKALNDLLIAYISNPDAFTDTMGVEESGNSISDVLDEAKYELQWLSKMQTSWGEVYSKAVTTNIPGDISPENDNQDIYVLTGETTATGDFAGIMALASLIYKDIDNEFSTMCLEQAKLSWDYLHDNATDIIVKTNPPEVNAGLYRDDKDNDERFYASIMLYLATNEQKYLDYAQDLYDVDNSCANGASYTNVGSYAKYLYLLKEDSKNSFYKKMKESLIDEATEILNIATNDGYNTSIESYSWGSNGDIVNNGIILMFAYNITDDQQYKQMAIEQLNYLFGKNSLNMTFVTGYGRNYPTEPHHRISKVKGLALKGVLVGGADGNREDAITQGLDETLPSAKVYADNYLSYSSNEVSIYWNSGLLCLLALLGYN